MQHCFHTGRGLTFVVGFGQTGFLLRRKKGAQYEKGNIQCNVLFSLLRVGGLNEMWVTRDSLADSYSGDKG